MSLRLSYLGRREDAPAASEEATETYRTLAIARPLYISFLVRALRQLANCLRENGRDDDATTIEQEISNRSRDT
jgi:hypothetical protein